jgi:hypothetical protein
LAQHHRQHASHVLLVHILLAAQHHAANVLLGQVLVRERRHASPVAVVQNIVSAQNCAKNVRLAPILTQKGLFFVVDVLAADTGGEATFPACAVGRAQSFITAPLEQLRVTAL